MSSQCGKGDDTLEYVATGVSPAYWCTMRAEDARFEQARMQLPRMQDAKEVAWLDKLLNGGIKIPRAGSGRRPITMLISGPPGAGKTTLAVELCVRLTHNQNMPCLYVSTDQDTEPLIENATDVFGSRDVFGPFDKPRRGERPTVLVCGRDRIRTSLWRRLVHRGMPHVIPFLEIALVALRGWHFAVIPHSGGRSNQEDVSDQLTPLSSGPDVVVIDGLNSVERSAQAKVFDRFLRASSSGVRLLIFVLDSSPSGDSHRPWEYACDLSLHVDYSVANDYYVRTLQVVKARYQAHVWGVHQFKPYRPEGTAQSRPVRPEDGRDLTQWLAQAEEWDAQRRRDHPYRSKEAGGGGALIYPSIHYYLSLYKRRGSARTPRYVDTSPARLSEKLGGGFPEGRCTAFIGARGGHKSHLGYVHLLHRISEKGESGIVVSLRDDESMTKNILQQILANELKVCRREDAAAKLRELEKEDRLEILYYHPGYITPEEFMHRLFVSLHRIKGTMATRPTQQEPKLTVLFNSLDQLASRFPLCAREAIFVPGMIEVLTGENVTSIFIAVEEPGQPAAQYGLLPMADLILSFNPHRFSGSDYFRILSEELGTQAKSSIGAWRERIERTAREEIVLQVVRFSGGRRAGMRGILELVEDDNNVYQKRGLHFVPIGEEYEFVQTQRALLPEVTRHRDERPLPNVAEPIGNIDVQTKSSAATA